MSGRPNPFPLSMCKDIVMRFGKYEGYTIHEMFLEDEKYCEWLVDQSWFSHRNKDEYAYLLFVLHSILRPGYLKDI